MSGFVLVCKHKNEEVYPHTGLTKIAPLYVGPTIGFFTEDIDKALFYETREQAEYELKQVVAPPDSQATVLDEVW